MKPEEEQQAAQVEYGGGQSREGHPRDGGLQEQLGTKLDRCAHFLYHRQRGGRGQGKILKILSVNGSMTQKELQEKLDIQAGSMSEIASKLEGKGLITRTRDGADKRCILLTITEEGRADVAQYSEARRRERQMFDVLTTEEQRQLDGLLSTLLESWEQEMKRPPRKGHGHHAQEDGKAS